jgi:hypothetical protein
VAPELTAGHINVDNPMNERFCVRCKTVALVELEPHDPRITFFECPGCRRHYALRPGKQLTFRWLHPISLALYGVISDQAPTERVADILSSFVEQRHPEELEEFVREIKIELNEPTQQVRDILDCRAPEQELRDYLRLLCGHLERYLGAQRRPPLNRHP